MRNLVLVPCAAATWLSFPCAAADMPLVDESQLRILARNFLIDNDTRSGHNGTGRNREWAQGFITTMESGFTAGELGVGVDAHAFNGIRLDGGRGRAGTGLLPLDSSGRAEHDYSSAGAALKARWHGMTVKFGEMDVQTPVLDTGDKRVQPEYATGALAQGPVIDGIDWVAGRFHGFKNQNQSSAHGDFGGYGGGTQGHSLAFAGVQTPPGGDNGGAFYIGNLSDVWRQYYFNGHWLNVLPGQSRLTWDANLYHARSQGDEAAGHIDNTAYSVMAKLARGVQALSIGYQKVQGDTPFDFVGGDSIYLSNAIKYADFNGPHEQSWQLRYDLDLAGVVTQGLSFMARYVRGSGIDGTHAPQGGAYNGFDDGLQLYQPQQGSDGRHWERDVEARYVVPAGVAKDLALKLSHVSHRANRDQAGADIDRLYLVIEYPLDLFLH